MVATVLSFMFIGPLMLVFTHNFVTSPNISEFALSASVALTVIALASIGCLYAKGLWAPAPAWHELSRLKKTLSIPAIPLFLFGILWVNLAISLPQFFTLAFGVMHTRQDLASKELHHSRRSCDHRLKLKSVSAPLFHYCISESLYNQLPETEIYAELVIRESALGYSVEDILINHSAANNALKFAPSGRWDAPSARPLAPR